MIFPFPKTSLLFTISRRAKCKSSPLSFSPIHDVHPSSILIFSFRGYAQTSTPPPPPHPRSCKFPFSSLRGDMETAGPLTTMALESISVNPERHFKPVTFSDSLAYEVAQFFKRMGEYFFVSNYIQRSVAIEMVASIPGISAAMARHCVGVVTMRHDRNWIHHFVLEAQNKSIHHQTWVNVYQPGIFSRFLATIVQMVLFKKFFLLHVFFPCTLHRLMGYMEEESVRYYTLMLKDIEERPNVYRSYQVPQLCIDYWHLSPSEATLKDLVLAIRAESALHRDANHEMASSNNNNAPSSSP